MHGWSIEGGICLANFTDLGGTIKLSLNPLYFFPRNICCTWAPRQDVPAWPGSTEIKHWLVKSIVFYLLRLMMPEMVWLLCTYILLDYIGSDGAIFSVRWSTLWLPVTYLPVVGSFCCSSVPQQFCGLLILNTSFFKIVDTPCSLHFRDRVGYSLMHILRFWV